MSKEILGYTLTLDEIQRFQEQELLQQKEIERRSLVESHAKQVADVLVRVDIAAAELAVMESNGSLSKAQSQFIGTAISNAEDCANHPGRCLDQAVEAIASAEREIVKHGGDISWGKA